LYKHKLEFWRIIAWRWAEILVKLSGLLGQADKYLLAENQKGLDEKIKKLSRQA